MSETETQVGIVEWAGRIASARGARDAARGEARGLGAASRPGRRQAAAGPPRRHFAWHAELWDGLVPVLHDHPEGSAITDERLREASTALTAVTEPKALYDDVLPLVVATYRAWSGQATPIAERPLMRVLDLVLHDLDFDAQEGHDLFVAGLRRPGSVPDRLDAAGIVNGQQQQHSWPACTCPDAAVRVHELSSSSKGSLSGEGACRARRRRSRPALSHRHRPVSAADEGR